MVPKTVSDLSFQRFGNNLCLGIHMQFLVNITDVCPYRIDRDIIAIGNHLIAQPVNQAVYKIMFAGSEGRFGILFRRVLLKMIDHLSGNLRRHGSPAVNKL